MKNLMGSIHPIDSSLSLRMTRTKRFDALVDDKITQFRNEQFVCQLLNEQRLFGFFVKLLRGWKEFQPGILSGDRSSYRVDFDEF